MIINKIILKNFQLFKDQEINLGQLNLITGTNLDSLDNEGIFSGNGAGKSTVLNAIVFGLFGDVTDINLKDLIRLGSKECSVILECSLCAEQLKIIRKIPNSLQIFLNGNEVRSNTATIAQKYLDELLDSDFQHFRTYNIIDQKKGINLLDLGITSLRKALMDFVNEQFIPIRQSLLSQKLERETYNVSKKLYTFYLSSKRKCLLDSGLIQLQDNLKTARKDLEEESTIISNFKTDIGIRQKIISYKEVEAKQAQAGICPVLRQKCDRIGTKATTGTKGPGQEEIETAQKEIIEITNMIKEEENSYTYFENIVLALENKIRKTKEYIMKLKEAEKFSAYKYTAKDVQLYADSVKVLDSFSSYYITEWLSNLAVIINDLLKDLNLSVEFSVEKDFIKINNNGQILNYSQLSSGQKKFLGTIFKIGILLQEGVNSGILLFDEGLGDIDLVNLHKLLDILKNLSTFQCIIIYQNCPKDIPNSNYINVERKDGESQILC